MHLGFLPSNCDITIILTRHIRSLNGVVPRILQKRETSMKIERNNSSQLGTAFINLAENLCLGLRQKYYAGRGTGAEVRQHSVAGLLQLVGRNSCKEKSIPFSMKV